MTNFLSPTLALGAVLATSYAALFHLWRKGSIKTLQRFLVAAWLGFAVGHLVGEISGMQWLQVGHLNVLNGTAGTLLALFIAQTLEA